MDEARKLRCLIAAGGTVGHVAPALAGAETPRARGATGAFAGAPDRRRGQPGPERGYVFRGLPGAGLGTDRTRSWRDGACRDRGRQVSQFRLKAT